MDIFTTALTKVVTAKLEPKGLKVKALAKEPRAKKLTEDVYHVEDHDGYYFLKERSNKQRHQSSPHSESSPAHENTNECTADDVIEPSEDVIIHKDEILHPKDKTDENKTDIKHLDIFV